MNRRMVAYILGILLCCEAGLLLFPTAVAFIYNESVVTSFLVSIGIVSVAGLLLTLLKPKDKTIYARDGLVVTALGWIFLSLFGALPFFISGEIPSYLDAVFETVSGFTTTGSSILSDVEALSKSMIFWRSFTHWIGGMGVLVFVMAVLPLAGGGGDLHLMRAESPGPSVDKLVPKSNKTARILYFIYFIMTVIEIVLLLMGNVSVFDSITLSFGTAGTGGFGILNSSIANYSPYCQTVITVFMTLFGINFNFYFLLILKRFKEAIKSSEVWSYLGIMFAAIMVIAVNITNQFSSFTEALRHSAFQVSSVMTTTGYATVDFNRWPELSRMILLTVMCIGACAGSTGGGFKVSRLMLLVKHAANQLRNIINPRRVKVLTFDGKKVSSGVLNNTLAYLTIYILIFVLSLIVLSADKTDFVTNATSVVSALNNIGPNLGPRLSEGAIAGYGAGGPFSNFGTFSALSKLVIIADMLLGRLEIFPVICMFIPPKSKSHFKRNLKD